tara:strand:- start:405 stop:524 length:120 start_codon:yes stop_codon:yes gene_type:complete
MITKDLMTEIEKTHRYINPTMVIDIEFEVSSINVVLGLN